MAKTPGKLGKPGSIKILVSLGLMVTILGVGIWGIVSHTFGGAQAGNQQQNNNGAVQLAPSISPLLFGTNMGLFDNNDQVLTSASTRSQLQSMHVRIIRMPVRSNLTEATEIQAAQQIKALGAVPLVVLRGAVDPNVLADNSRIVNDMNAIFGHSVVYYEFGNEEDLLGVDVHGYTASWNAVVPQLKRIALQGQFVGPVNFQYDRAYLTTFLQNANPRPDEVSWHEYTCDDSWASSICISHIANWSRHFADARAAMQSVIGTALPIMITEWNYAPNAVPNDGKNNDSAFMSTWTATALQTLAANGIFASMQYSCTNTAIPMVSNGNAATVQGTTFASQYQTMITGKQQPPPIPTPIPGTPQPQPTTGTGNGNGNGTPTTGTTQLPVQQYSSFSFEDGSVDGWAGRGEVSQVQNTTAMAMGGKHSLQVTLTNMGNGDFPFISVGRSNLATYPKAGQTVTMYLYLPAGSPDIGAKIFVMDDLYHWYDAGDMTTLTAGTWNSLTFTLPAGVTGQLRQLGVQFNTSNANPVSGDVFLDSVGWQ
jgi:Mannanase, galactose-binding domain-like